MLVSHRKQFIYTKTAKTASTSVEAYFEPYCMREGEWQLSHGREECDDSFGIIGYRGPSLGKKKWRDHMPAMAIQSNLSMETWNAYFKFCVVRNPFDRLVSGFHWLLHQEKKQAPQSSWQRTRNLFVNALDPFARSRGKDDVERFRHWLRLGGDFDDRDKYMIDGQVCLDFFIRYESLREGIAQVCEQLEIPFEEERLPKLKSGLRATDRPVESYYDSKSVAIVEKRYQFELDFFGYQFPTYEPGSD